MNFIFVSSITFTRSEKSFGQPAFFFVYIFQYYSENIDRNDEQCKNLWAKISNMSNTEFITSLKSQSQMHKLFHTMSRQAQIRTDFRFFHGSDCAILKIYM